MVDTRVGRSRRAPTQKCNKEECLATRGIFCFQFELKSTEFCLSRQAEYLHAIRVLPFDDEFRQGIAFFPSHEKSWQGVAKRG